MKGIEITDLPQFRMLSALDFSEDGAYGVFCVSQADVACNDYRANLWLLETESGAIRQLTSGGAERSFTFSGPDSVVFPGLRAESDRKAVQDGQQLTVFYRIDFHGGEARELFRVPLSGATAKRVGENLYLISALFDNTRPDFAHLQGKELEEAKQAWEEEKDYQVLDELPFWANGRGFTNKKRRRLYLYRLEDGTLTPITGPLFDTTLSQYCRECDTVVYTGTTYDCVMSMAQGLYAYDLKTGETRCLMQEDQYMVTDFCVDSRGKRVLFGGNPLHNKVPLPGNTLYAVSMEDGAMTTLIRPLPEDLGVSTGCDLRYGSGHLMEYHNGTLYLVTTYDNTSGICTVCDGETQLRHITTPDLGVDFFAFAGEKLYAVCQKGTRPQELFAVSPDGAERISRFNVDFLADKYVAEPQPLSFTNQDGVRIDGFVLLPIHYDPDKRYPGILEIHGGPRTNYSNAFMHEMQALAGAGYFVFFCNPRGSSGRGEDFANIRGKFGTIDYEDLMAFTDVVLERYPQIDPQRLGVTGGSYGGFMTNWIIGHTDRFQAAASQRSISNWISEYCMADNGPRFSGREIQATPWTDPEAMWRVSPLRYADKAETPTLFIHSVEDYRCGLQEGIQMYSALMLKGVPTRMCVFYGENHELSRSGKPKHRLRRLKEIKGWMDHYLMA